MSVHNLLKGTLRYLPHSEAAEGVAMLIEIPGLTEFSTWNLRPLTHNTATPTTEVTHRIQQRGPLARLIGQHEASLVPGKRLHRLAALLESARI
ncbi:hypothetical protein [Corynebacterium lowii]|uniref:Polyketide cyclase / dehydrase and lipid transport n=1 Tax=Corynebacterium lowii TaxID=1544413 RepID=A0A0Q0UE05_9CORY|nr:hypothetical protein [Corynebacterium lowii]KQB84822.1 hypothetical protein Clow_02083 [Corynebacterium lowii]MDP9851726.1 hypothetical protein [Corynebacterium lowii]